MLQQTGQPIVVRCCAASPCQNGKTSGSTANRELDFCWGKLIRKVSPWAGLGRQRLPHLPRRRFFRVCHAASVEKQ